MDFEEDLDSYYNKTNNNNNVRTNKTDNARNINDDDDYDGQLFSQEKIEINDLESVNQILGYNEGTYIDLTIDEPAFNPGEARGTKNMKRKKVLKFILILSLFVLIVSTIIAVVIAVPKKKATKELNHNASSLKETKPSNIPTSNEMKESDRNKEDIFSDSFYVELPPFSFETMRAYASCSNLLFDVEQAAMYLSNLVIQNAFSDDYIFTSPAYAYDDNDGINSFDTNNQVDGVDEADIVKSDGNNIYLSYGNELVVVSIDGEILSRTFMPQINYSFPVVGYWDPMDTIQKEQLNEHINENIGNSAFSSRSSSSMNSPYHSPSQKIRSLLLHENRLAVIIEAYQFSSSLMFIDSAVTAVLLYDVNTSDGTLTLVDKTTIRGTFRDARSIQNQVHVVTLTQVNASLFSSYLKSWMFPSALQNGDLNQKDYRKMAYARAKALIPQFAKQLVAELLGSIHDGSVDNYNCNHIFRMSLMRNGASTDDMPDLTSGNGILNSYVQTTSFDMQSKFSLSESISGAFLPSSYLKVYSSKDMLVMAAQGWKRIDKWEEYTYLMGFDISNGAARPSAVGEVPGYLLNQYSLDHYDGHLRAATTISASWGMVNGEWTRKTESQNQITVLQRNGNKLLPVGMLSNVATGERIYSVRFMEDKAFVVTFKQIDPFITFDLSDPTKPVQVGELKLRGVSNYLHPTNDENFILAVGQDANETTGMPMGLQISLFDTTDFANPKLAHKFILQKSNNENGYGASSSDAQYNPKVFRYVPSAQKLILPISKYSYNSKGNVTNDSFDGFQMYNVDKLDGITKIGEIIHADASLIARSCFSWTYMPSRSMVFDSKLLTIKGHAIVMTNSVFNPNRTLWRIDLDEERTATDVAGCMPWFN